MTSLENILSRITSPSHFARAAEELENVQVPKITLNILRILRNILSVNNKDIRQFNGLIIVLKIFKRGLIRDLTDSDWSMLHGEFSKTVIATFESILHYKKSDIIKQNSFCQFVLQVGQLLFPLVHKIEKVCQHIINEGFNIITALICLSDLIFSVRKSLFLLFKPIILKADILQRKQIMKSSEPMFSCLASLIITCGDYEMQEVLIETLMRFSLASKKKLNTISIWFQMHLNDLNLIKVLDYNNFDATSREFLNALNSATISDVKVITLPVLDAYANEIPLKKPSSSKYRELWIDFSTSTATIHTVCEIKGSACLRLSVEQPNVKKIRCSKRIINDSNALQFLIELYKPMRVNLCSPEVHVAVLTLIFLKSQKIVELQELFFKKYYKEVYEEPKLNLISSLGSSRGSGCLCDGASSVSSIHTSSSFCEKKICQKGAGKEFEMINKAPGPESHFLATSTPKAPLPASYLLNLQKENSRQNGLSHLKNMCQSDFMNNEFLYNKFCNPNKWRKGSLIKYCRNTLLPDEDRKFKEMCEKKLAEVKNNQPHLNNFKSPNEANKNTGLTDLRGTQFLDNKTHINKVDTNRLYQTEEKLLSKLREQNTSSKDEEKNEASDESPYILISSKEAKSFTKPINMNSPSTQENSPKIEGETDDKAVGWNSRLQKMRRLLTQGMSSGSKFTSPLSENTTTSQTLTPKENKIILQPSKLNFSRPFCSENRNTEILNLPYQNHHERLPPESIFCESKSQLADYSDRIKISSSNAVSKHQGPGSINVINLTNLRKVTENITEPFLKKAKMSKMSLPKEQNLSNSLNSLPHIKDQSNLKLSKMHQSKEQDKPNSELSKLSLSAEEDRSNSYNGVLHKNEFLKDSIPVRQVDKVKQSKTSENIKLLKPMKPSIELDSSRKLKSFNITEECCSSKKCKVNFDASHGKDKFSSEKKNGEKAYDWSSSLSVTDHECFSSSLKSENCYNISYNGRKGKFNSSKQVKLKLARPKLSAKRKIVDPQALSPNTSMHCRIPRKTYGHSIGTRDILETTSEKIFRDLQSSNIKSNPFGPNETKKKKRKLFNPNSSLEESFSLEKENANVSYSSSIVCNKTEKENIHCKKQMIDTNSGKNRNCVTKSVSKIMNELSSEEKSKPQFQRKSLRNKSKVKYEEISSSDVSTSISSYASENNAIKTLSKNSELKKKPERILSKNFSKNAENTEKTSERVQCSSPQVKNQSKFCKELVEEKNDSSQRSSDHTSNNKISLYMTNKSLNQTEISSNLEKSQSNYIATEPDKCQIQPVTDQMIHPDHSKVTKHPLETVVSHKFQADGSEEETQLSEFFNKKVPILATDEENNKGREINDVSICSESGKLKEAEAIYKLTNTGLSKKCAEFKEDAVKIMDSLKNCCDDFIKFILNNDSET